MTIIFHHRGGDPAPSQAERIWLDFLRALQALAPEAQAAFVLHVIFETSYADIARMIGQPAELCRQQVEHARAHALAPWPRRGQDEA